MLPDDVASGEHRGNNSEEYKADILDKIPSDFIPCHFVFSADPICPVDVFICARYLMN